MQTSWYGNGQISNECNFKHGLAEGKSIYYSWEGTITKDVEFQDGKMNGTFITYNSNGGIKRRDIYLNDSLKEGNCFDKEGKKVAYFKYELIMPEYRGGVEKMMQYVSSSVQYPPIAMIKGIEGRVIVDFVINKKGRITDVVVVKSLSAETDAEARRVIASMQKWKPGLLDGEPISVKYTVPIKFALR